MVRGKKTDEGSKNGSYNYIFPSLGIYGLADIEDVIIAGLVTGDPILLVGTHGSAKTLLAERIAASFGLKFHAYDASKALWEDVIGFPNPESLKKGIVDYTPTEISIWDKEFILVDEISRANPQMQNKWLEVIRSRRVMGKKLKNLKYIFAAMNPIHYIGAIPLDDALAGRFSFIVEMPSIDDMEYQDLSRVIRHISVYDMPLINKDIGESFRYKKLVKIVEKARAEFIKIEKSFDEDIIKYVSLLAKELRNIGYPIDGRRAGMMRRGLISYLSVLSAKKKLPEIKRVVDLYELFGEVIKSMLPTNVVVQNGIRKKKISYVHLEVVGILKTNLARKLIDIFFIKEPEQALDILEREEDINIKDIYSDIMNRIEYKMTNEVKDIQDYADMFDSLILLQRRVAISKKLSPNVKRQILEFFQRSFFSTGTKARKFLDIFSSSPGDRNKDVEIIKEFGKFNFFDPSWNLRFRILMSIMDRNESGVFSIGTEIKDIKSFRAFLEDIKHIKFKDKVAVDKQ